MSLSPKKPVLLVVAGLVAVVCAITVVGSLVLRDDDQQEVSVPSGYVKVTAQTCEATVSDMLGYVVEQGFEAKVSGRVVTESDTQEPVMKIPVGFEANEPILVCYADVTWVQSEDYFADAPGIRWTRYLQDDGTTAVSAYPTARPDDAKGSGTGTGRK